jgi:hypothetical protein
MKKPKKSKEQSLTLAPGQSVTVEKSGKGIQGESTDNFEL